MAETGDDLDIPWLVDYFSTITYNASIIDPRIGGIQERVKRLFLKDYNIETLTNTSGELCGHYPKTIIIPTTYKECEPVDITPAMKDLVFKARLARCWSRFPAPVIVYKDKFVCRSATLATTAEILGRSSIEWLQGTNYEYSSEWETCDKLREADKELLKFLKVKHIFDMMVENKKVKFGVSITSSEKADKEKRYCEFDLYSVPYPGTEFFTEFRIKHMCAEEMFFDWEQAFVNAQLKLPDTPIVNGMSLNWDFYKDWNLIDLTNSYMMLLIRCLGDGEGGLLLHCISGWDRTPLFVSLLRLSLWADGAIHQNLNAKEILYLTIAYDWLLFGHQLEDRLSKQEDVFLFCFYYLQYLKTEKFSIHQYEESSRWEDVFNTTTERVDSQGNMVRCTSIDSFTDTVCSTQTSYTNSTVNGAKRSSSPATLVLDEKQSVSGFPRQRNHTGGSTTGNGVTHSNIPPNANVTTAGVYTNGTNGGTSCTANGATPPSSGPGVIPGSFTAIHAATSPSSPGNRLYASSSTPSSCEIISGFPNSPPTNDHSESAESGQNYRGSNSSIDSWFMVSGNSHTKDQNNTLDRILESKRLQKLETVRKYFGEAMGYLIQKGTLTATCSSSWTTILGQLADSVSQVTFGMSSSVRPTSSRTVDARPVGFSGSHEDCRNTFEMVALNSFNGTSRSVT